eukprot:PhF_6_TR36042/c3_g1_i3/m.52268
MTSLIQAAPFTTAYIGTSTLLSLYKFYTKKSAECEFSWLTYKSRNIKELILSLLCHADLPHLVWNQLIVLPFLPALEKSIGETALLQVSLISGLSGWGLFLWNTRRKHGVEMEDFITVIGNSGIGFGQAMCASVVPCEGIPAAMVPAWAGLTITAPYVIDVATNNRARKKAKQSLPLYMGTTVVAVASATLYSKTYPSAKLSVATYFLLYNTWRLYKQHVLGRVLKEQGTTDHACHLGGAIAGLVGGLLIHKYKGGNVLSISFSFGAVVSIVVGRFVLDK